MKIAVNSRKTIGWVALLIGFLFVVIPGLQTPSNRQCKRL
jgi:hypothetical protein